MVTEKNTTTAGGKTFLDLILNRDEVFRKEEPEKFLLSLEDTGFIVNIYFDYIRTIEGAAPRFKSAEDGKIERRKVLKEVRDDFLSKGYDKERVLSICETALKKGYWCTTLTSLGDIKKPVFTYEIESNKRELQGKKVDICEAPATLTEKYKVFNIPDNVFYASPFEVDALNHLYNVFSVSDSEILEEASGFSLLPNNKEFNYLVMNPKEKSIYDSPFTDVFGNTITPIRRKTKDGEIILNLFNIEGDFKKLAPLYDKSLRTIMHLYMKNGNGAETFTFGLSEYMELRGLKDKKRATEQIRKELSFFRYSGVRIKGKNEGDFGVISQWKESTKGQRAKRFTVSLAPDFRREVFEKNRFYSLFPLEILKYPDKQYEIARAITNNKRRNLSTPRENCISIREIKDKMAITPPEDVKDKGHMPNYQIKPIDDALEWLVNEGFLTEFTYEKRAYGNSSKTLTEEELRKKDKDCSLYDSLMVRYKLAKEPNYDALRDRKASAKALNKPKRGRKKSNNK